ncbi:hypothetical protein E2H98_06430 [Permianibacter aggregans]|uniref:Uncharacterized protein n=1 Tax=Permianibacter aggregans TaxID=1510150 RepID=A0A4R6URP9_9GAMM|nr:hypothetical protein [Permianibacter aggregans]QGX39312.1 hypothetical protein E2H98_06430 [Permianibacter aggregans]TDQ49950.1 hypothetical protein EV696_103325 [Permianibacter aggregans]
MKSIGFPAPVMPTSFATGMFTADRMLRGAATLWLCAALFGQFFFLLHREFLPPFDMVRQL